MTSKTPAGNVMDGNAATANMGDLKLAIIGCGRMGEAILAGLLKAELLTPDHITVTQPDAERCAYLRETYEVTCVENNDEIGTPDVILLAVKPQVIASVLDKMRADGQFDAISTPLIISIAVGVTSDRLSEHLPAAVRVIRVMPNTPALVGSGMSVISAGKHAGEDDVAVACAIFDAVGSTVVLDERLQDVSAALSGSGPAYFEAIVDALSRVGVKYGLPRDVAQELVVSTMGGTAELIEVTGEHPQVLIDQVTSPGGTTIAALEAMERSGLRSALAKGVGAAIERAKEL